MCKKSFFCLIIALWAASAPAMQQQETQGQTVQPAVARENGLQLLRGLMMHYKSELRNKESRELKTNWALSIGLGSIVGYICRQRMIAFMSELPILKKIENCRAIPFLAGVGCTFAGLTALSCGLLCFKYLGQMFPIKYVYSLPTLKINRRLRDIEHDLEVGAKNHFITAQDVQSVIENDLNRDVTAHQPENRYAYNKQLKFLNSFHRFALGQACHI